MGRKRVDFPAFAADPRGEPEPGALAPAGIALEGCEIEALRRIEFIEPRVEHRLELGAGQREGVDRGQERQRGRVARGFRLPLAPDDAAPPCEPQGREVGIAGAHARLADLEVEGGEGMQRVASVRRGVECAEPLVVGVLTGERGTVPPGFRQRRGADRTRRHHGAAIRAAATRRFSDCITL